MACDLVKQSVEALSNVASVSVSRSTTPAVAGVSPQTWTYSVTFTGDLCAQPLLELVGDAAFMASSTLLTTTPVRFTKVQSGECEVQTVTTAASVESLPQVLSVATWLDDSAAPTAIGGSFDLTVAGAGTITVPVATTAAQLEALLEGLPLLDDVSVASQSADYGASSGLRTWLITFNEILGSALDVTLASKSALTGNAADVRIKQVKPVGLSLGGSFVLNFLGDTTVSLPFDIEPVALKRELENLRSIVEVDVQKEERFNGNRWTVSFTKNLGNLPLLDALPIAYEIQSVETVGGAPTPLDGTFRLAFRDDVTAPIACDASDAALKAALEALPAVGGRVDVTRTDRLDAGNRFRWLVTFRSLRGDVGNLAVADTSTLSGSGAGVTVTEVQPGNAQSLTGENPTLAVFEKRAGRPSYTARYTPRVPGNYSVAVQQLVAGGLEALYYDNYWLQDAPVLHRVDATLSFDWGTGAITAFGRDYVSVRWFGKLSPPFDDDYVFSVTSSEGVRVWFDHALVVDTWEQAENEASGTAATFRATLRASAFYDVKIEYHEETGAASFLWRWSSSRLALAPVPSSALFHGDHIVGSPFAIDVTPGATDFPYTTAFGDGLSSATAGIPAAFTIQAKDQNGNNKTLGGDAFRITINSANALLAPFSEPVYRGNGQYRVEYLPGVSGTYQLSIQTLDGSEIQCGRGQSAACSPFSVTIAPGPTTPHTSQALGVATSTYGLLDPLVEAVAGQAASFVIQARDTYGNARWTAGNDSFETTLVLTTDRRIAYRSSVLRIAGGTPAFGRYEVQYSVPRAGTYELQTTLRQAPILMCPTGLVAACLPLGTPSTLKVVHSALHAPSSTVDDTASGALSSATSNRATTFNVLARDAFGNLRTGDRTAHSWSTGDGRSDVFLATLAGPETVVTSSAVQTLTSADQQFKGVFALSFGVFSRSLCEQCVVALTGTTLSLASGTDLVALLLPGTKFTVQQCIFTAVSVTTTSVSVAPNHGCADFTAQQWALQVAPTSATRLTTTLLPQDVSAAALKYALQDLHLQGSDEAPLVHVTQTSLPPAAGNAGNVGRLQWSITFVSPLAAWSAAQLAVEYPSTTATTTLFATPLTVAYATGGGGGVYPITYTPTLAGVYLLSVTTPSSGSQQQQQQHVQGSPFTVTVRDDVTHGASSLSARGNALVAGFNEPTIELEAGTTLSFGVQLKDQRRLEQQVLRVRAVTLDVVSEVQKVVVTALPLTLSFRGAAVGATLQNGDTFATVKSKLEALTTITDGGLQVSAAPESAAATAVANGVAFLVTFVADQGALPLLQVTSGTATPSRVVKGVTPSRREAQTLTCTSSATPANDGLFSVSWLSQSVDVAANAAPSALATLLSTLVGSSVSVAVEGGAAQATVCSATPARLLLTFTQALGNVPALTFSKPAGSVLSLVAENDVGGGISGVYPAWGSFRLYLDPNEPTVALPFDASAAAVKSALEALTAIDQVAVSRDVLDVSAESSGRVTAQGVAPSTLVQWTVTFSTHSGDVPLLRADSSGLQWQDDGQLAPVVTVDEYVRGTLGNNRSLTATSDISVTLSTVREDPGIQEVQVLSCRGSSAFTLSFAGQSAVVAPDASLLELEAALNTLVATGIRVYRYRDWLAASALETAQQQYVPVCSLANVTEIALVFEAPADVALIAWSATSNDVTIAEVTKGAPLQETPVTISNLETQQLACLVAQGVSPAQTSFSLQLGDDPANALTVVANTAIAAFASALNALPAVIALGGVDVTSAQPQVCLVATGAGSTPAPVSMAFRGIGDPPTLRVTQQRDGIASLSVTESVKGLAAIAYSQTTPGLFVVTARPQIKGVYTFSAQVLGVETFHPPTVVVHPSLADANQSLHDAPSVLTQGVSRRFSLQAVDRFLNPLDGSTELGVDAWVLELHGPRAETAAASNGSNSDRGPMRRLPVSEAQPNTNGRFDVTVAAEIAGDYVLSLWRRQAGGLWGSYFRTRDFGDRLLSRVDAVLDFAWGETPPLGPSFPNKDYSVEWRGELRPPSNGSYVLTLASDDAVSLSLDGVDQINTFLSPSSARNDSVSSAPVALVKGQFYALRVRLPNQGRGRATALRVELRRRLPADAGAERRAVCAHAHAALAVAGTRVPRRHGALADAQLAR
ncbi:hypothetical protein PINS_up012349 [Pythium insidiosum]|nr:hypothetical protein PINS_up012349 [Pythium insidiosum]